jgi:hypothetical protein
MKIPFKRSLMFTLMLFIAMLAMTFSASAQRRFVLGDALTIPTVATDAVSNNVAAVVDVSNQGSVSLEWTTASTNVVVRIGATCSGTSYSTNRWVITLSNGTTVTNLNTAGIRAIRIDSVANTGTIIATNTVYAPVKWD